jgi:hypothetical protein
MFAEFKFASNPSACKGLPSKYKAGIVTNVLTEQADQLARYVKWHPNATAADVAREVLGVPGVGTHEPRQPEPEWYYDPGCYEHGSDGRVTMPDGGAGTPVRCECARREPYAQDGPETADIIDFPRKDTA